MATDLDDRPTTDAGSDASNPGQKHADDVFNELTSKEHMAKDGQSGDAGENDGGLFNAHGDKGGGSSAGSAASGASETTAEPGGIRGLYNKGKDTRQGFRDRAGKFMKKKWLVGLAVGGGGLGMLALLLVLLVGTFKIPHLAENITAYQFARVTQQMSRNTTNLLSEKISVDSASKTVFNKLESRYATVGKVKEAWGKLDKFRPNKIISNMQNTGQAAFEYKYKNGRQVLAGIQLNDRSIPVTNLPLRQRVIPGFKLANNIKFSTEVAPRLNTAIRSNAYGPIIRGRVAKKIRQELGISLIAWKVGEFKGKSAEQARLLVEQEAHEKISGNTKGTVKTEPLEKAVTEAVDEEEKAVADDNKLKQIIRDGGNIQSVRESITQSFKDSPYITSLKFVNGAYALAVPICIVYDGSLEHSGDTIDQQTTAQQKAYYLVSSAADQQKDGTDGSAEATGAYNDKLGDINGSIPMQRAAGEAVDTSGYPSAEGGAGGGTFSLANALFGNSKATSFVNAIGDKICPQLTDVKLATIVAAANIGAIIFSGGTAAGAEGAAQKAATTVLGKAAEKIASTIIRKKGAVNVSGKVGDILTDSAKSAGKIAGATILAKLIVMSKAGYTNNGLEQGKDFANMADSGGNIAGNEQDRKQFYAAPLTKTDAATAAVGAYSFVNKQNEAKNPYQRYVALSNPQSLLSRFATTTATALSGAHISSLLKQLGNLLDPTALFSMIFAHINPQAVHAAAVQSAATLNYGNIQFGYTPQEQAIMDNNPSYQHLENQYKLDQLSDKTKEINDTYDKCFTGSLGDLIAKGYIKLNDSGDVQLDKDGNATNDAGLCAPNNLSFNNRKYGDLVFRWRVAHNYDSTLNQLDDMQNISNDATTATNTGAGTSFRIATYNVLGASHPSPLSYTERADRTINTITTSKLDIVGFQEFQVKQRDYIYPKIKDTYDIFPAAGSHNVNHSVENSIIWNHDKFDLVGTGQYQPNVTYFCFNKLNAPYLKLRAKDTGQEFYVLNTHDPSNSSSNACSDQAPKGRYEDALEHAKLIQQLEAEGLPVLFTGDFNSKYALVPSGNGSPYQGKAKNLTYCIVAVNGPANDAYDAYKKRAVTCPNTTPPGGAGGIDHVYLSKSIAVTNYIHISGGNNGAGPNGSDHPTIIFDVSIPGAAGAAPTATSSPVTKVLTIVEENHSIAQMKKEMPYAFSLAQKYGYATNYSAIRHPSLPNYISIAGGSTMGVADDNLPSAHKLSGQSIFGQAIAAGKTAKLYAESMPANCVTNSDSGKYRTKHNPWAYFVDERALCNQYDVPLSQFNGDVSSGNLPNVGMLIPNMCNDAHNCSLSTADAWFKQRMQTILAGPDWQAGRLAIVLTADEDDNNSGNKVLTIVIHPSLASKVVTTSLNHYSLSQFMSGVGGGSGLREAQNATPLASAFGLSF